jgi:hypothetical protein
MPNYRSGDFPSPWKKFLADLDGIYGLSRTTGDIDYYTSVPANLNLEEVAGENSPLHKKHKVWLHRVGVANLPEDYVSRLTDMAPGQFKCLTLLAPDPYDCILSKLERAGPKDRDDADYLFRSQTRCTSLA